MAEPFHAEQPGLPAVRGFLHRPLDASRRGLVLTHGAGGNCQVPLLLALAEKMAQAGILALRCDLPYRQARPKGPPSFGAAARDRLGLRAAVEAMRGLGAQQVFLGGISYGGRQASMLAAEQPGLFAGLLLISYPLHPPGQASRLRTGHFPSLGTDCLFVHGTRDNFGSIEELRATLPLIPARTSLLVIEDAGHGLTDRKDKENTLGGLASQVVSEFRSFLGIGD